MDRQAVRLINMLDDETEEAPGVPRYDVQLKMRLFAMGQDWLTRRQKLRPSAGKSEGAGITDMRAWMNGDEGRQAIRAMLDDEGFVRVPEPKSGRPTTAESRVRERYKANKAAGKKSQAPDRGWQEMLKEPKQ